MKSRVLMAALMLGVTLGCTNRTNAKSETGNRVENTDTAKEKLTAGQTDQAYDFTLKDLQGNDLSLSSLRGKYVIIDFWGSWCKWCIKGFPEMKKCYEKYSDRLEILGVDCGDSEEAWKAAVSNLQLPWKHVYCPQENRAIMEAYAIQGFPTKFIIDPEGKVVKDFIGEDPAFYTFIDSLFE